MISRVSKTNAWETDPATSKRMRGIGGKHSRAEVLLRSALFSLGLRYKLHDRSLPGSPDLVFPKYRAVIFVNGCYWHRHQGCSRASMPLRNADAWVRKFNATVLRDQRVEGQLTEAGWHVFIVWECEILSRVDEVAQQVRDEMLSFGKR